MTRLGIVRCRGFSYVEILVAMGLIAVALLPAMDALRTAVDVTRVEEVRVQRHYAMLGRLESVLAQPFGTLQAAADMAGNWKTPTSYSDAPGADPRLLVFISAYDVDDADKDGNPFTGTDPGVLWVRVAVDGTGQDVATLRTSS